MNWVSVDVRGLSESIACIREIGHLGAIPGGEKLARHVNILLDG